jgi:uncharacterized membrane protein
MKTSTKIILTWVLFSLNAAIWLAFGIVSLVDPRIPGLTGQIIAFLMFGNAGALLLSAYGIGKRKKWLYFVAGAVLAVNILLTFSDQMGVYDWATLALDLVLVGLLIAIRKEYPG